MGGRRPPQVRRGHHHRATSSRSRPCSTVCSAARTPASWCSSSSSRYRHQGRRRISAIFTAGADELAEMLGQVREVLAQPHQVRRQRELVVAVGAERGRRQRLDPAAPGLVDLRRQAVIPGPEDRGAVVQHLDRGLGLVDVMGRMGRHRVRGQPQAQRAADQAPELLLVMCLVPCSASRPRSASSSRRPAVTRVDGAVGRLAAQPARPLDRLRSDTSRPSGTRRPGRRRRPRTTPRGQNSSADEQADRAADRDVLDPHHADLPADRHQQVEQDRDRDRERGLADRERRRARRVGGDEHGDRQRHPERRRAGPDRRAAARRRSRTRPPCRSAPAARSSRSTRALVRSTDSVPSTTQNPCWTVVRSATATAAASASAPRRLLMNHTERRLALRTASPAQARDRLATARSAGPASGRRTSGCPASAIQSASATRAATSASAPIASDGDRDRVGVERDLRLLAEVVVVRGSAACRRPMLCGGNAPDARGRAGRRVAGQQRCRRRAGPTGGRGQQLALDRRGALLQVAALVDAVGEQRRAPLEQLDRVGQRLVGRWPAPVGRNGVAVNARQQLVLGLDAARPAAPRSRRRGAIASSSVGERAGQLRGRARAAGRRGPAATSRAPPRCPTTEASHQPGEPVGDHARSFPATPPGARRRAAPR